MRFTNKLDLEKELYLLEKLDKIEVIVKYVNDLESLKNKLNIEIENLGLSYAIITLKEEQLEELSLEKNIIYIEFPKRLYYSILKGKTASCINTVYPKYNLTGKGVLVSIIDSGIDLFHPGFIDEFGNSRVLFLWDQTIDKKPPVGFSSGTEYTNEEINNALKDNSLNPEIGEIDTIGHGTAVSGIACGNGKSSNGLNRGVAPNSSMLIVKLGKKGQEYFAFTTEIMRAIKYSYEKAIILNMPLVINLSFGTNDGSHEGNTLFEQYIDSISETWKSAIVVASGNEGFSGHHYSNILKSNQVMNIPFTISSNLNRVYITFWKNFVDDLSVELITPTGVSAGLISNEFRKINKTIDSVAIFSYYGLPTHYNEKQEIFFDIRSTNIPVTTGIWTIRIHSREIVDGNFNIWLPTVEEVTKYTSFSNPIPTYTLTIPSSAQNVITTGGYDATINALATFSGQGSVLDRQRVKPDLVAPAVNILTTKRFGGYDTFTGTSMAAPFVSGSVALMFEWGIIQKNDPFLYGQKVKAFLQMGAKRDGFTSYPNPVWGYGKLCLDNTMRYLEKMLR